MAVSYDNLINVGAFEPIANIETVTVAATTTLPRGALLGKITATGKYILSLAAAVDGSEVPSAILYEEIANATAGAVDTAVVVYKAGSFNSTGVTFGTGHTVANTKDALHNVSIEIAAGVL